MQQVSRRQFNSSLLHSLFTLSLVETLCGNDLFAKSIHAVAKDWLIEVEEASRALRQRKLAQSEWQSKIAEIFARVEPNDLLRAIDFDRLRKKLKLVSPHEAIIDIEPAPRKGLPEELSFNPTIYGMKRGAVIPPHCHRNMTSMHMPIGGALHGWQFDRIADETDHLIVKPTMDRALRIGEVTTISDEKDNVHWFQPTGDAAYTFSIAVYRIDKTQKFGGRQFYVDAAHGDKVDGDKLQVRKLSSEEAYKIYGNR